MFKQEVLLGGGGGGPTLTFNKSGEEEGEEDEGGMTADRFYKGVRQVPGIYCPVDPMTFCCGSADPCLSDQWIRILLFSSLTFKTPA